MFFKKTSLTLKNTAAADYVTYAKQANARLIYTLPAGPYSPMYMKDQDIELVQQRKRH